MNRVQITFGAAILLATAGVAAGSTSVLGVGGHTAYVSIILTDHASPASDDGTLAGLITCDRGSWLDRIRREVQHLPTCAGTGYVYAYPAWAGQPWDADELEVVHNKLEVDDTGRLWNTLRLRYAPSAMADHPDGPAMVDAFAVELQEPGPSDDGRPANYHLTIDAEDLQVQPEGLASYALGIGPAPGP